MMRLKPQDQPAEYSKYLRNSRYTLWKARRVSVCHVFSQESWKIKTCTGSQEA